MNKKSYIKPVVAQTIILPQCGMMVWATTMKKTPLTHPNFQREQNCAHRADRTMMYGVGTKRKNHKSCKM